MRRTIRARPDLEVRRLLLVAAFLRGPGRPGTLEAVRRDWQVAVKAFATRDPVAEVRQLRAPGPPSAIPLRAYVPHGYRSPGPCLVWFHGGGFVAGDLYTAGATCRALAKSSGAMVMAVGYRLAPEHSVATSVADCLRALQWVHAQASRLGVDDARLAVGGDSAGGGLAALVAQHAHDRGIPLVAQALVYPATDLTGSYPSASKEMPGLLNAAWVTWMRSTIARSTDLADPSLSALATENLSGLPPAIIITAGFDPLRDEGIAYADRLRQHQVEVQHLHFPGQIHGFLSLDRVLSAGQYALQRMGTALADAFTGRFEAGTEDELPPRASVSHLRWFKPQQRWHEAAVGTAYVAELAHRAIRPNRLPLANVPSTNHSTNDPDPNPRP